MFPKCQLCKTEMIATEWNKEDYGDTTIDIPVGFSCPSCQPPNKAIQADTANLASIEIIKDNDIPF